MNQSSGGLCVSGSGEKREKKEFVTCLHDHSLAVVGSRTGIDAHIWLNVQSMAASAITGFCHFVCVLD